MFRCIFHGRFRKFIFILTIYCVFRKKPPIIVTISYHLNKTELFETNLAGMSMYSHFIDYVSYHWTRNPRWPTSQEIFCTKNKR